MIDPFDAALSEFIDTLPEDAQAAQDILDAAAPFTGQGDLPALAELATVLRSVPPYEPRPEWVAASKARLMAAPILPPEKRGFTWLGSMFLPLTQLSWPSFSLPQLGVPAPAFARAAVALALIFTLASVARDHQGQNPILQVTTSQAPVENAEQAITSAQQEMARLAYQGQVAGVEIKGSPRDVVLLSKRFELAEEAIDKAPPAEQPRLRSQLQSSVRAVRFDGLLEGITNGSTLQVSGVAIQADQATVQQLRVGQPVSMLVSVGSGGKLQAEQVAPAQPSPEPAPSVPPSAPPAAAPPPPAAGGGTAPQTSQTNPETVAGASPATVPASPASQRERARTRADEDETAPTTSRGSARAGSALPVVAAAAAAPAPAASVQPSDAAPAAKADKPEKAEKADKPDKGDQPAVSSSAVAGATTAPVPLPSQAGGPGISISQTQTQSVGGGSSQRSGKDSGGGSSQSQTQAAGGGAPRAQSNGQGSGGDNAATQSSARSLQVRAMPQVNAAIASVASDKDAGKGKDKDDKDKGKDKGQGKK